MSLNTDKLNGIDFTPTPRTDRAWVQGYDSDYAVNGINKDFAEKLERELNEANVLLGYKNDTANTFMNQVKKLQKENEHLRKCCDFDKNGNPVVKGSTLHLHSKRTNGTICEMTLPVEPARKYCWYNTIEEAQVNIK
jgi:hypothetical protein